jgi:hypothetical protein
MPKAKKIRAPSLTSKQQVRHEPLGQAIEGDDVRGKYAAPVRARRNQKDAGEADSEYFDEKTSQKIVEMTRNQQLEMQAEEEREAVRKSSSQQQTDYYSEEEEEEIEEILIDEDEE